jgi:tetratricopeptide (TPR) repeat protein
MLRIPQLTAFSIGLVMLAGCATTGAHRDHDQKNQPVADTPAQIFPKMGPHRRAITTTSAEAQAYFDQGLTWAFAFNHDEAIRSFRRAAELDPECAMAWWGVALASGPQYNHPKMTAERDAAAWEGLQKATARIENTTPVERALIEAMGQRYAKPCPEDRTALNEAYAEAMGKVWAAYPDDADVGTLYAESRMVLNPWKMYTPDRKPAEGTEEIVVILGRVLEMDPDNPGANHLYIHAVEPSADPGRGLPAANRLSDLVPGSGHLEHMPSHIYVKVGMWDRAIEQNAKAMRSDEVYRRLSPKQHTQWVYMVHNSHMLTYTAMMAGREREALAAARAMWAQVPEADLREAGPLFDRWMCSVYDVQKRFGRWDAILAEPAPPDFLPITRATWRASRAVAYAAKKDFANAEREYEAFKEAMAAVPEDLDWGRDPARKVLEVSDYFIAGEIALQKGEMEKAAELLEKSAEVEDMMGYGEPPQWLQPVRHTLGAVYLVSGRYADAERVYREDLAKWRNNGWSLYGLSRALKGQGETAKARRAELAYRRAWSKADAQTTTSCKCIPNT